VICVFIVNHSVLSASLAKVSALSMVKGSHLGGGLCVFLAGERPVSDDRHQSEGPRIVPNPLSYGVSPIAQEADKEKDKGAVCHVVMVH
jgi:hypothetical protein